MDPQVKFESTSAVSESSYVDTVLLAVLDSITDGYLVLDDQGYCVQTDERARQILRLADDDASARPIWEALPRNDGQQLQDQFKRYSEQKSSLIFEWRLSSTSVTLQATLIPIGKTTIICLQNLTESRRSGLALKESRKELSDIKFALDESSIVAITDQRGVINFVNDKFCQISKYNRDELLGQDHRIINSGYHSKEFIRTLWTTIASGKVWKGEIKNRAKDGTYYWVDTTIVPFLNADGKPYQYVAVRNDITERKEAEERLVEQAALLNHAQDAILVRDLSHNVLFWNNSAERIYGWTAEEAVGRNIHELTYPWNTYEFDQANKTLLEYGEWQGELNQVTKDGREIIVEGRWTLVRDDKGLPRSILIINTDVTSKKKLESQFLRAQRMESIGTLAGGIAHDLNNVLSPILMITHLLQMRLTDDESKNLLATIATSAERGSSLVKQVLSFARGAEGEKVTLPPSYLIREIAKILKDTLPKSIQLNYSIADGLSAISGDLTQLHQVLMNLCVNARDAMPQGGKLTIDARNTHVDETYAQMQLDARPGKFVLISVTDTGIGIPHHVINKIFEPFFTTKDQSKGTGLGLSTVLGIVKGHSGFINVYSEVGKGTQFRIYLPAAEAGEIQQVESPKELPSGHGELILVVDDEAAIREITKGTLEAYGYKVLTAGDGTEAVAIYAEHRDDISLVLTDMMMPYMDGPATIRALQRMNPGIRIIAATGLSANAKMTESDALKVQKFLVKPYTAESLLFAVAEVLK